MIVDDRLETVLRTSAAGPAGMRVQFRQLADLLGRAAQNAWSARHDEGLARLDSLFAAISAAPAGQDGALALLAGTPLAHRRLVTHFAGQGPRVALAAIRSARLFEADWLELVPRLPIQARGFLRHRRDLGPAVERLLEQLGIDDFALTAPEQATLEEPVPQPEAPAPIQDAAPTRADVPQSEPLRQAPITPAPASASPIEGIGAIVRRIEAFRRDREARPAATPVAGATASNDPDPRLPFADEPPLIAVHPLGIDLSFDSLGMIVAAEPDFAPMLVGHRPFQPDSEQAAAHCDAHTLHAFAAHLPIEDGLVVLDGAEPIAGAWRLDAVPLFARAGGSFGGYRGRLRRPAPLPHAAKAASVPPVQEGADRLRQTLHELRTPINAIQGFAEMIQQQVFGATPHQYRSLAASIAADAARMLAGFEDLERLARLETGQAELATPEGGTDLAGLVSRLIVQLDPVIAPREVRLRWQPPSQPVPVHVAPGELEHTIWRLLAVIASTAAPGERLSISLDAPPLEKAPLVRLDLPLPAALAMRDDAALFAADSHRGGGLGPGGMMGNGFALRLAAAEVRAMGGQLHRDSARLLVDLPCSAQAQDPSAPLAARQAG